MNMSFNVADYLADTPHLSTIEHGAYLLIIFNYWQRKKPIKESQLHFITRMTKSDWDSIREVISEFFEVNENLWSHNRIDRDLKPKIVDLARTPVKRKSIADSRAGLVKIIFEYWQEIMGKKNAKLDLNRKAVIIKRLADGYSVDDIKKAIVGCSISPFHQGQNDKGTKYDDIELICRHAKHIDRFMSIEGEKRTSIPQRELPSEV